MAIFISESVKSKNPNFARLADRLQVKLNKTVDVKLEREHQEAKVQWMTCQILYLAVKHVLLKFESKVLKNELSTHDSKCWTAVKNFFTMNECKAYLSNYKRDSLLGIDEKTLKNTLDAEDVIYLEEGKNLLHTEVETYLCSVCLKLTALHDGKPPESSKVLKSRSLLLGEILESEQEEIKTKQDELKERRGKEANAYLDYKETLQSCGELLTTFLEKYWLNLQPKKDQIYVKNARACVENFTAKLRSERLILKRETYTTERVEALNKIRAEIETTTKQREYQLSDISRQLAQYRQLGSEFEAVVAEYGNVCNHLEKQIWTLAEIKKTSGQE